MSKKKPEFKHLDKKYMLECPCCPQVFQSNYVQGLRSNIRRHAKRDKAHISEKYDFTCDICGETVLDVTCEEILHSHTLFHFWQVLEKERNAKEKKHAKVRKKTQTKVARINRTKRQYYVKCPVCEQTLYSTDIQTLRSNVKRHARTDPEHQTYTYDYTCDVCHESVFDEIPENLVQNHTLRHMSDALYAIPMGENAKRYILEPTTPPDESNNDNETEEANSTAGNNAFAFPKSVLFGTRKSSKNTNNNIPKRPKPVVKDRVLVGVEFQDREASKYATVTAKRQLPKPTGMVRHDDSESSEEE